MLWIFLKNIFYFSIFHNLWLVFGRFPYKAQCSFSATLSNWIRKKYAQITKKKHNAGVHNKLFLFLSGNHHLQSTWPILGYKISKTIAFDLLTDLCIQVFHLKTLQKQERIFIPAPSSIKTSTILVKFWPTAYINALWTFSMAFFSKLWFVSAVIFSTSKKK